MNTLGKVKVEPKNIGFLLLDNFTLISFSSAIEPLRLANHSLKEEIYTWSTFSEKGETILSSDGININVDFSINSEVALNNIELLIVCGGLEVEKNYSKSIARFLRNVHTKEIALGAICTGSRILAMANLLNGYSCSVHWDGLSTLSNLFPNINVRRNLFTIDRDRFTSSGGIAPFDMMLKIIRDQFDSTVSSAVAEQFISDRIRRGDDEQRIPLKHLIGSLSDRLIAAVQLMEANIREPINQADLAAYLGLSTRQLQRLFKRYLNCSPSRYYLQLRLQRAKDLLQQTSLNILEITSESGFISVSHFSKSYKSYFGYPPSYERNSEIMNSIGLSG
jgi:transcriptional regulator GlxA family with amidase domain|tara:strand:- start:26824 stop:27828 length:1005 start_codon:yes stop_codon:yes gene_type:complete